MPELAFFRRGEEVLRVALEREGLVLGRGQGCDVIIPDPQVSRRHVALRAQGGRCILEDLSGHGTLVAGQPMRHGELADGADLKLGQSMRPLSPRPRSRRPSRWSCRRASRWSR